MAPSPITTVIEGADAPVRPGECEELRSLRLQMIRHDIDCYLVPFQGEHDSVHVLAKQDNRISFVALNNFTVTSGCGVVTPNQAFLHMNTYDGQMVLPYLKKGWSVINHSVDLCTALSISLSAGARIGYDPYLVSPEIIQGWKDSADRFGFTVTLVQSNLVDLIWINRPLETKCLIEDYPARLSGETWQSKIDRVRKVMTKHRAELLIIACIEEVAWLFNLRGSHEVDHSPMFKSFALITAGGVQIYVKMQNVCPKLLHQRAGIKFIDIARFYGDLQPLAKLHQIRDSIVWIPNCSNAAIREIFCKNRMITLASPLLPMLVAKNPTEVAGFREACLKDSIVGCELLKEIDLGVVTGERVWTELDILQRLHELRTEQGYYGTAFGPVSAVGPNSSMQLYQSTPLTNKTLSRHEIFLLDTGGMYITGNTDWTRTWHFSIPTPEQQRMFAAVLNGYKLMTTCKFPTGTQFSRLANLGRVGVWRTGNDFDHAIGHGVGHFLNGVEYPIGLETEGDELYEGSVVAIEPGHYVEFEYGLRHENQYVCVEAIPPNEITGAPQFLRFEAMTFMPICRKLVDVTLLEPDVRDYINAYHEVVLRNMVPALVTAGKDAVADWVTHQCRPL